MTKEEKNLIKKLIENINHFVTREVRIMEICGTHTHEIGKLGLRSLLNPHIKLISGPGCPVCVTGAEYIDALIYLLKEKNVTVITFGDLLRVKGSTESLEDQKGSGRKIITVYSPEEALYIAKNNPEENMVFAAVGFETTAPIYGALIKEARNEGIKNLFFLTSLKRMEPAIRHILNDKDANIDGMLCPGHVAAITGISQFLPITAEYRIPAAICGFEAMDIIGSMNILLNQIMDKEPVQFINTYKRCVNDEGNLAAIRIINEVFEISHANWRGIGPIENSAFCLKEEFSDFDALKRFNLNLKKSAGSFPKGCECGNVLTGKKSPDMCANFGKYCTPDRPLGPCMISSEGACAAYHRYN
ncbi:hydrogenase formation protein HypD [Anaeropeptidivorans aminofermentans]|uniref:hydrogenase formation protein HypD n=1 Tax=Anaeropeptidivorans aminofermentans TaxID=2934315 RepID=UPI002025433B|nr:hydrogenase formation protein HypD [Anaeropeptidivorans aminofermentans]